MVLKTCVCLLQISKSKYRKWYLWHSRNDHLGRNYGLFTLSQRDHQANYLRRSTLLQVYDMIFTNAEHDADSIQENEKRIYHIKKEDKVVGQNLHLKYDSKYHLTETSRQHKNVHTSLVITEKK